MSENVKQLLRAIYVPVKEYDSPQLTLINFSKINDMKKYLIFKRIMDIILSVIALIILSPLMILTAIVIVIDDPGSSPIYVQHRVGKDGKLFKFYKFRSMYHNAEEKRKDLEELNEMDGPVFKIKNDPRITRVGKFIRKTSIDELPQIINVIKGDMTLVGPRPALPNEVERYDEKSKERLSVIPGLTCYWQIQPNRNCLSFDEWIDLDLRYIRERCIKVDIKIILKTFKAIFGQYGV